MKTASFKSAFRKLDALQREMAIKNAQDWVKEQEHRILTPELEKNIVEVEALIEWMKEQDVAVAERDQTRHLQQILYGRE